MSIQQRRKLFRFLWKNSKANAGTNLHGNVLANIKQLCVLSLANKENKKIIEMPMKSDSDIRDVFDMYDFKGDMQMAVSDVGEALRSLGLNPSNKEVGKSTGSVGCLLSPTNGEIG